MDKLDERDFDFIVTALNAYWNDAHYQLTNKKELGDMEKENLRFQKNRSKEIMTKLGVI